MLLHRESGMVFVSRVFSWYCKEFSRHSAVAAASASDAVRKIQLMLLPRFFALSEVLNVVSELFLLPDVVVARTTSCEEQ